MNKNQLTDAEKDEKILDEGILCEEMFAGNPEAGREFYNRYFRLARYFGNMAARRCVTGVVDEEDLFQDALGHMLESARSFDISKNMQLSSWVSAYMRPRLDRALSVQYGAHIPQHIRTMLHGIYKINDHRRSHGLALMSDEDIADEFDIPEGAPSDHVITVGALRQAMLLTDYLGSLDRGFSPHSDTSPGNAYFLEYINGVHNIWEQEPIDPSEAVVQNSARHVINDVLDTLDERERGVMRLRYGLDDDEPKTLDQIGQVYGISRERVRQLERQALIKLRHHSRSHLLTGLLKDQNN